MKQRGLTLIEVMVLIVIAATAILIGVRAISVQMGPQAYSYGANGLIEVRCMDNMKFIVGENGHVTQMLDNEGHGIKCNDLVHRF
jgi:competence protein ComGC